MRASGAWEIYEPFSKSTHIEKIIEVIKGINTIAFLDNIQSNIVKNIAQELDCGSDCYYNPSTDELIAIPNFSQFPDDDEFKEAFRDSLVNIEKHRSDFMKFEALDSFESFKIMERFVREVPNDPLKKKLENALNHKKPFQNFKYIIDHSEVRQSWFDFKQRELEKIVAMQLAK